MANFNAKTSNARINELNKAIATGVATVVNGVQIALVLGLVHARETGDCTPLLRTVQAMGNTMRREQAINYVARFSPVVLKPRANKGEGKCGLTEKDAPNYVAFDVAGAEAAHWTDKADRADEDALTLTAADKAIFALAKRLESSAKKDGVNDNDAKVIATRVAALRAMAKTAVAA